MPSPRSRSGYNRAGSQEGCTLLTGCGDSGVSSGCILELLLSTGGGCWPPDSHACRGRALGPVWGRPRGETCSRCPHSGLTVHRGDSGKVSALCDTSMVCAHVHARLCPGAWVVRVHVCVCVCCSVWPAGLGWGWGWGGPVTLCGAAGASPQLCQLLLVEEEMLSSHLRSFDWYGPIVWMGKPRL